MRKIILLLCCLPLLACSRNPEADDTKSVSAESASTQSTNTGPVLSWDAYGALHFGVTLAEAEKLVGKAEPMGPTEPACHYVRFASLPGALFMVENSIITRADVEPAVPNATGIAVGGSFADAKAKYPAAIVEPHKYVDGHYLILKNADGSMAVVMEETGGKITEIRAGLLPAARYVEGCS